MTWATGRDAIGKLLGDAELELVRPSREHADLVLAQARGHLASAQAIASADPPGAYQLAWDAARKAMVAVLENQGLRPTRSGGHIAVADAVSAQCGDAARSLFRTVRRMRRRRNESEYPSSEHPAVDVDEVSDVLPDVAALIEKCAAMLDVMDAFS